MKKTTFPQTFSTTPHHCAQTRLWEFWAYHSHSSISKHLSRWQCKKATQLCVHSQRREKKWDTRWLGIQQQIQRHCCITCEKPSLLPLFLSYTLDGLVPLSASLQTKLVAPAEKKKLCQHQKRAGRTNDDPRKCSSPIKVHNPQPYCPVTVLDYHKSTHQMQGHLSTRPAVKPKANCT